MTLAGQLERSVQIPLPAIIASGHEVQSTLDQCERLVSKNSQLEDEREVVADLVMGHDLAMAQNQLELTADWFAHRMNATHTPAAAASKTRALQELKDQRALGGKDSYQSMSGWQQTAPRLRGTAPPTNPAGAGKCTLPLPPPPVSNPGTTPHLPEATELAGTGPGGSWGGRIGEGAAAAADVHNLH